MNEGLTPIRQQYISIKKQYPDAIVFFRLGDFYETFDEDAEITAKELEIVLTSREMGKGFRVPLAGIPYHALDNYLAKLISRGYKVAICEQVTKPGETKGLVQREVVRLVTPGTVVEPSLLDSKTNNYLISLVPGDGVVGLACVDISTSEFTTTQFPYQRLGPELKRLNPSEVIAASSAELSALGLTASVTRLDDYWFEREVAENTLLDHFNAVTLEGYGCAHLPLAIKAAGAILHYINETQKGVLRQLTHLSTYSTESFMALDEQTQRNLELFRNSRSGTVEGSLLSVIDLTRTAMGGRLLKRWLGQPLFDVAELVRRRDAIGWFYDDTLSRNRVIELLEAVADLERLINRVKGGIALPRELATLRRSLEVIPEIKGLLGPYEGDSPVRWLRDEVKLCSEVVDLIAEAIADEPASSLGEGGVIKPGFSEEMDGLYLAVKSARQYLANLEMQEREKTGIKSLKVRFNQVFGYYIEVSKANFAQVPKEYIRKQTLVNGERFYTPELKEYETLILSARDKVAELETSLFNRVCLQIGTASERILATARALANVDVLSGLAEVAVRDSYVRPDLTTGKEIVINQGRHPVVERSLTDGGFVPNDIRLDNDDAQIMVLTGPNMSGKSTYLRQVALIVLLAQIGSFVPAASATIGVVDRIFTRVGAREDLAAGQSTFMVEMVETANILNNATSRSLIILDEIGRGTSTYDGLAIARAVTEYIHNHSRLGAKTIFATHYHEMVELATLLPRVKNFNVAVTEEAGNVVFLYRIMPGGVDKSYGIHVAQLAGLPKAVIKRANEVLTELESGSRPAVARPAVPTSPAPAEPLSAKPTTEKRGKKEKALAKPQQMSFFGQKSAAAEELAELDIDGLSPLDALTKLYELKKKAG